MATNAKSSGSDARLRAVLLDVDGTLVDSNEAHARAWTEVLTEFGYPVELAKVRQQIGKGGDQLMPVFLPEDVVKRDGEAIEERRKELFKARYLPHLKAFPQTRELVERLQADGRQVVLASSAKGDELENYKRLAQIDDLIEEETSSDDAARSKPHPDIFEAALARLDGVGTHEAVVIGDSPYDAEAAQKAAIRCIGVLSGNFTEAQLREAGCAVIYRDVADLLAHYDESPLGT